jgi:hypothetical protein
MVFFFIIQKNLGPRDAKTALKLESGISQQIFYFNGSEFIPVHPMRSARVR